MGKIKPTKFSVPCGDNQKEETILSRLHVGENKIQIEYRFQFAINFADSNWL